MYIIYEIRFYIAHILIVWTLNILPDSEHKTDFAVAMRDVFKRELRRYGRGLKQGN